MMSALSIPASAIACFASLTDSSGVVGDWMLASAMRTVSVGLPNSIPAPWLTREPAVRHVGATPQARVRYSQLSFRSLIDITRNCGSGASVFTVSLVFVSGASSRSTLVSVLVLDSPAGIIMPVTSTL